MLPSSGDPWQPYTIRAVRPIVGGDASANFVACHDVVYPYTVYKCHDTGLARLYMVDMEGSRGSNATVAVICHIDTSQWDPKHLYPSSSSMTSPAAGPPVCHTMPFGHMVWAKNGDGYSSVA
ncbi:hypothetical protein HU200_053928 [Digitaria exilis]|uniref:BURP domain-containing protein n=1 Tax=Digitaria exilis TaxID=1010633 RepID=A0A835E7Z0_9POAL|nr:hypothetical protein HU200_053928 [Digitaria exilis]